MSLVYQPKSKHIQKLVRLGVTRDDVTFERDAVANTFDSDGLLQSVAVDTPRTVWIDGVPLFWIDGQVTEISGRSDDIDNMTTLTAAAATKDAVGLDGEAITAWTVEDDSGSVTEARGQATSISDDNLTRFGHFIFKHEDSPSVFVRVGIDLKNGTSELVEGINFDKSDGTYVEQGQGSVLLVERVGDYWHVVLSMTNNSTGNTLFRIFTQPAFNTDGTISADVTTQGSTVFGYAGAFTTNFSFLPVQTTGGVTKTVPAENASIALGPWFKPQGSIDFEFLVPAVQGTDPYIWELRSDDDNRINVYIDTSDSNTIKFDIRKTGESLITVDSGVSVTALTLHTGAVSWQQNLFVISIDGTTAGTVTSGEVPPMDTGYIGSLGGTSNYLFGGHGALTYKPTPYTAAQAEAAST